jgi:hypothetical protein
MLLRDIRSNKGRTRSLHYHNSVFNHARFANNAATIRVVHQTEQKCCGQVGKYSTIKEGATTVGKKSELHAVKPLADVAECPFVRNIFVIFSRITLSFKKRLSLFTSDYKVTYLTTSGDPNMPVEAGRNIIHTVLK